MNRRVARFALMAALPATIGAAPPEPPRREPYPSRVEDCRMPIAPERKIVTRTRVMPDGRRITARFSNGPTPAPSDDPRTDCPRDDR